MQIVFFKPKYFSKKVVLTFSSCHRIPERSFFWKGRQFPLCARCTGICIGFLSFPLFIFNLVNINLFYSLGLLLPAVIDATTQAFFRRESNNWLRVATGIMSGIGVLSLIAIVGETIGRIVLAIIK